MRIVFKQEKNAKNNHLTFNYLSFHSQHFDSKYTED